MNRIENAENEAGGGKIRAIKKSAVHKICAGQVILDLSSAVKELVENSLDAGATSIAVSLFDYGQQSFQVSDNGSGISPHNFKVLAIKHHTSKLSDFPDLQSLTTFGFRGEALSSLCALGDLTVETRTVNESVATLLTFDHSGVLVSEKKTARQIGTTVTVKKLFSNLPVRSREFSRNIRKEYGKLISLLNAYALIAKGVRIVCSNTTGKNVKSVVLKTQGSSSLKDNIITVFGMSTFNCLEHVTMSVSDTCKVEGFLSKPGQGSGRNLGDRQYFFVNGRPVDMPKVGKLVNEMYRGANSRQYPIAILNFTIPTNICDVNVTPDKRKIFFSDEVSMLQSLREGLLKIYSPNDASYSVHEVEHPTQEDDSPKLCSFGGELPISRKKSSDDANDSKEFYSIVDAAGADTPLRLKNFDIMSSPGFKKSGNSNDGSLLGKDFSFRVHNFKKADNSVRSCSGKPLDNFMSSAKSKTTPPTLRLGEERAFETIDPNNHSSTVQSSLQKFITVHKRKREDSSEALTEVPVFRNEKREGISEALTEVPVLRNEIPDSQVKKISTHIDDEMAGYPVKNQQASIIDEDNINKNPSCLDVQYNPNKTVFSLQTCNFVDGTAREKLKDKEKAVSSQSFSTSPIKDIEDKTENPLSASTRSQSFGFDAPMPSSSSNLCFTMQFKIEELKKRRQQRLSRMKFCGETCNRMKVKGLYAAATLELSQPENEERKARALAAATTELERLFRKEDFGRMKVIGQFNLGFIIGKLDQDLFIVDQHAADEKYNFERLSQSTILNLQPLLRPLRLELSPEEEVVASMNMDIIRKNGFALEEDLDASPGQRYKLKAVPFSKNITFGVEDVKELISTLSDSQGECSILGSYRMDTTDSVCPSRVRAMFASRACRSSIMIGDPLGKSEMQKILEHLAGLRSPWNCPHGRPTMRHLVDLTAIYKRLEENDQEH